MINEEAAGAGTEEEAPADEDGEGARVGVIIDHKRQHPVHHHNHHVHHIDDMMEMEHLDGRIKTGPDEMIIEPDCDLEDDFNVIHQRGIGIQRKAYIPAKHVQNNRHVRAHQIHGDTKATCVNCEGRFRATKMHVGGKLCANCNKIHESIKTTAQINQGNFTIKVIRPGKVQVKLICAQQHEWTIGMQSRKAKNWCRVCKDEMREEMRKRHLEQLQRMASTQHQEQDTLFDQERHQMPPDIPIPDDSQIQDQTIIDETQQQEIHELLVEQVLHQNRITHPQVQFRVAELFLNVDERTIIDFLQRLEDTTTTTGTNTTNQVAQRTLHQLVQRLRLCLHPDKNREHPCAAEAFARM